MRSGCVPTATAWMQRTWLELRTSLFLSVCAKVVVQGAYKDRTHCYRRNIGYIHMILALNAQNHFVIWLLCNMGVFSVHTSPILWNRKLIFLQHLSVSLICPVVKVLPYESLQKQAWVWIPLSHVPPPRALFLPPFLLRCLFTEAHPLQHPLPPKKKKSIHAVHMGL